MMVSCLWCTLGRELSTLCTLSNISREGWTFTFQWNKLNQYVKNCVGMSVNAIYTIQIELEKTYINYNVSTAELSKLTSAGFVIYQMSL